MNAETLRRLATRAEAVEGRQADRLTELHARIRSARRRRGAVAAAAAAALVVAVVAGGAALTRSTDQTREPVDQQTPRPTPSESVLVPTGQTTIGARIRPGDVRGWELVGSRTNTQPQFAGDAALSLTAQTGGLESTPAQSYLAPFCNGDADTWWVLVHSLDGFRTSNDAEGGLSSGSRARFGACSRAGPTSVPAPRGDIEPSRLRYRQPAAGYPVRMFVTQPLTLAAQQCLRRTDDPEACLTTHGVAPISRSDARFGVGVYEHRSGPSVLEPFRGWGFEALAMADGVEYLVSRAVVSAPAASRLVVALPASDRRRIVAIFAADPPALEACARALGQAQPTTPAQEQSQLEEFDRRCLTSLELRLDGRRPEGAAQAFVFGDQQAMLPPGPEHTVTVDVTRNDPRNVRFAIVVWEERT